MVALVILALDRTSRALSAARCRGGELSCRTAPAGDRRRVRDPISSCWIALTSRRGGSIVSTAPDPLAGVVWPSSWPSARRSRWAPPLDEGGRVNPRRSRATTPALKRARAHRATRHAGMTHYAILRTLVRHPKDRSSGFLNGDSSQRRSRGAVWTTSSHGGLVRTACLVTAPARQDDAGLQTVEGVRRGDRCL